MSRELREKLAEAQRKRNTIFADIESLRANEAEADAEITKIKAELEKPELRHGDYGTYANGTTPVAIMTRRQEPYGLLNIVHDHCTLYNVEPSEKNGFIITGNIFDDLKRNSEDLEAFKMNAHYTTENTSIKTWLGGRCINILICDQTGGTAIAEPSIEQAVEFHQKLGQLIATFIRKAKK